MKALDLDTFDNSDDIIQYIDENNQGRHYIILSTKTLGNSTRDTVSAVKRHYDIVILYEGELPTTKEGIDTLFAYGFHGVLFHTDSYLAQTGKLLSYAVTIFAKGAVLLHIKSSWNIEQIADKVLAIGVLPVVEDQSYTYSEHLLEKLSAHKGASLYGNYISKDSHSLSGLSFTEKIKLKIMLELHNLKQRLMVKDVYASFESSSL